MKTENDNKSLLDIIKSKDLKAYLEEEYEHKFEADKTLCPFHADTVPSFSVFQKEDETYRWNCFGCEKKGSIIDYEMQQNNLTFNEAVDKLAKHFDLNTEPRVIAKYPYTDESGNILYTIQRWDPPKDGKKFNVDPNMEGKKRVLYWLPEVLGPQNPIIFVVEGERDVESVRNLGLKATTWPFGISQWDKVDLSPLKGKTIWLCLDADVPKDDVEIIATAIYELGVKELKIVELPGLVPDDKTKKDITDWLRINEKPSKEEQALALMEIAEATLQFTPLSDEILIKNAFLRRYVEIHSKITDASPLFLLFSGLALLSAVANHFYFMWTNKTFLNLYILLLAQSTTERKSTVIDMVHDYLKAIRRAAKEPRNLIFPSFPTPEAFVDVLKERPRGILIWRELNTIKSLFSQQYGSGLPHMLTDISDGRPYSKQTKNAGFVEIDEPVVSILCGGIGEWLVEGLKKKDFQGGIWTRFIFVPAPLRKRTYRLPRDFSCHPEIVQQLQHLPALPSKKMNFEAVKPLFEHWMQKVTEEVNLLGNTIVETFYQKLEIHVLKIACLLQLVTNGSEIVEIEAMEDAITIGERVKRSLYNLLLKNLLVEEWDRERAKILKVLEQKGECKTEGIWQYANVGAKRGNLHLSNLVNEGMVGYRDIKSGTKGGRPGRIFFLV